jgi:putative DNA modification/repair radical SAM protein
MFDFFLEMRYTIFGNQLKEGYAMDALLNKLEILGDAAKYDASCSSSGSGRQGKPGGMGNAHMAGICHTWAVDGRCVSLLKVLLSNSCIYNCTYCQNRCDSGVRRATFEPAELAKLTFEFYRRNYIEGLFLSSGVVAGPDRTMELMIKTMRILREEYGFCGYIHVKAIPSADPKLIDEAGLLADRISVNIELPTSRSLALLAPKKSAQGILTPMEYIHRAKTLNLEDRRHFKSAPMFAPAGQTTQMIVGATPDSDLTILRLSKGLYKRYSLKRVYFSAYIPVGVHPSLPGHDTAPPLLREHRLYQADWLMRFYGFDAEELFSGTETRLDDAVDPKCAWALKHPEWFPVEINSADFEMLLRVPGIGNISARRILQARRNRRLELSDLRKLGVVMKRAQFFVTAKGRFCGRVLPDSPFLKTMLAERREDGQISLFDEPLNILPGADIRRKLPAAGAEPPALTPLTLPPAADFF